MLSREPLSGGREGKIFKTDDYVIRPLQQWTYKVHHFLNDFHHKGHRYVPKPIAITEQGEEWISFMPGEVYNYPLPVELMTDDMLISVARLLRTFHDDGKHYLQQLTEDESWMLPVRKPVEVMCHGDFAPYNVTIINNKAVGIIDFDTLHPGNRMWDIAYAIYRWVPFTSSKNPIHSSELKQQIRRAILFCEAYGVSEEERLTFADVLIERLEALVSYITLQAEEGNSDFIANIVDGHLQVYVDDIQYLKDNRALITLEMRE